MSCLSFVRDCGTRHLFPCAGGCQHQRGTGYVSVKGVLRLKVLVQASCPDRQNMAWLVTLTGTVSTVGANSSMCFKLRTRVA